MYTLERLGKGENRNSWTERRKWRRGKGKGLGGEKGKIKEGREGGRDYN